MRCTPRDGFFSIKIFLWFSETSGEKKGPGRYSNIFFQKSHTLQQGSRLWCPSNHIEANDHACAALCGRVALFVWRLWELGKNILSSLLRLLEAVFGGSLHCLVRSGEGREGDQTLGRTATDNYLYNAFMWWVLGLWKAPKKGNSNNYHKPISTGAQTRF